MGNKWRKIADRGAEGRHLLEPGEEQGERLDAAICLYEELLLTGGSEVQPLNGEERIDYVKAHRTSRFAIIQLDALFEEMIKKSDSIAARR